MLKHNRAEVEVADDEDVILFARNVQGLSQLGFELTNTGDNALANVDILVKFGEAGKEIKLVDVAGDFTTPNSPVVSASGDLNTLAADTTGWCVLDVRPFAEVIVRARAAAGGTTVDFYASGA